jgi:two-component system CheB/CheR fusion protein
MHPDDVESTLAFLDNRNKLPLADYEFEARVRRPDGSYRWVISRGGPIITEDGVHLGWSGSVWDIHDRKMAEEALLQYSKRLEVSNRELEQFATIASHDLQEPLRKVMMFSDHLRLIAQNELNAEALDDLERIQRGTRRMQRLIEDLLNLSRVTRRGEAFEPTDLQAVLTEVIAELSYNFPDVHSRVDVSGDAVIEADYNQIRQVFVQLLDNAMKFHLPGRPSKVQVNIETSRDGLCRVSISDNGLGIKPEYLDRIFNTFVRLHHSSHYPGTGIGLTLVQKIVERHNGNVTVSSEAGYGSTFTVILPVVQEDAALQSS